MLGVDIARSDLYGRPLAGRPRRKSGHLPQHARRLRRRSAEAVGPPDPGAAPAVTLEPTGGYELRLAEWALAQGWTVHVPNPHHVRAWATGIGRRAKTDRQDALLLARYGAERALPPWQPLPTELSELESLVRRKDDLAQLLRQERNRQHALSARPGVARAVPASVERVIGLLEEELRQVEEVIAAHLQAHTTLQETLARLRTVPGIGERTAVPLLVTLGRWDTRTGGPVRPKRWSRTWGSIPGRMRVAPAYISARPSPGRATASPAVACTCRPWAGFGGIRRSRLSISIYSASTNPRSSR